MSARFEQLDHHRTPMGEISLRRRFDPVLRVDVYEAKLDDEFLMSSLFTAAETELARIPLSVLEGDHLDVVVGGLGLGYTARAVLEDPRVRSLRVVEALPAVIDWHERGLLPLSAELTSDPRCQLVPADFFSTIAAGSSFGPGAPDRYHAILVDIDHSPRHLLHPDHGSFYEPAGLRRLAHRLHAGGVYGLWSDDPPDEDHLAVVEDVFSTCEAHVVRFPNPFTGGEAANTVYVARAGQD